MKINLLSWSLVALATLFSDRAADVSSADIQIQALQALSSGLCTITVYNDHDDDARDVNLQVLIPFQTRATRVSEGCIVAPDGRVVNCNLGNVGVGRRKSVKVYTNRAVPAAYRNNLFFSAYVSNSLPDPNLNNNFESIQVPY